MRSVNFYTLHTLICMYMLLFLGFVFSPVAWVFFTRSNRHSVSHTATPRVRLPITPRFTLTATFLVRFLASKPVHIPLAIISIKYINTKFSPTTTLSVWRLRSSDKDDSFNLNSALWTFCCSLYRIQTVKTRLRLIGSNRSHDLYFSDFRLCRE